MQFKLGDEVDLKDFLPDPKIQSSQWMIVVNLNTSLYLTNNCVDQSFEKDYIKVKEVQWPKSKQTFSNLPIMDQKYPLLPNQFANRFRAAII